jgi:Primase C terminal 1 (PriCT-1)
MNGTATQPSSGFRVPDDLSEYDQWVLWRYEARQGKRTKVPYQVNGKPASSTNRCTWTTFEEARTVLVRNPRRYAGVGFVFTTEDNLAGLDLDDSLDEHGRLKAWAREIAGHFSDTYAEVSPSSRGLKIWARGSLPSNLPGVQVGDGAVELYDHARYFAVTGRVFRNAPFEIEDHGADLLQLYERLTAGRKWPSQPLPGGQIPHGQQHNTLVSLCGTLRARGICEEAIESCLQVVNTKQCEKPGAPENIVQIVRSSRKWRQNASKVV